jgi:hypothetical protein
MNPICFMVMPFQTKPVTRAREGAPSELDCDRLWDLIFRPLLEELGYLPIRADLESSSVIVKDMLNRLRHADLVLADLSLPNGNVYYELGIRHVAQEKRCVQVAAEWFKPLFDAQDFRTITYPLKDGRVSEDEAAKIRAGLKERIKAARDAVTPYHRLVDETPEEAFETIAERIASFQADISEVRLTTDLDQRKQRIEEVLRQHAEAAKVMPDVAIELVHLVRDAKNWKAVRDFVESLPESARKVEVVQEQYFLALSELGEHAKAIAGIKEMNRRFGPTPERCGLIGGRYKRLFRDARGKREIAGKGAPSHQERQNLRLAIQFYEQGMMLDLNEYYCSCNLPALLQSRGKKGDEERARSIDDQVIAACRRAQHLGTGDEWLNDTLFGTAFRQGKVEVLDEIVEEIEGGVAWKLGSTLDDARDWIRQAPEAKKKELAANLEQLKAATEAAGS